MDDGVGILPRAAIVEGDLVQIIGSLQGVSRRAGSYDVGGLQQPSVR